MAKTNYVLLSEFSGSGEYSNRTAEVLKTVELEENYYGIRKGSNY